MKETNNNNTELLFLMVHYNVFLYIGNLKIHLLEGRKTCSAILCLTEIFSRCYISNSESSLMPVLLRSMQLFLLRTMGNPL